MAKICKSCGAEYKGSYCDKCGYGKPNVQSAELEKYKKNQKPVRFMTPEEKEDYYEKLKAEHTGNGKSGKKSKKKRNDKKVLAIVALLAVVVIVVGLLSSDVITFGSRKEVIESYFEGISTANYDEFSGSLYSEVKAEYDADITALSTTEDKYLSDYYNADFKTSYGDDFTITVDCNEDNEKKLSDDEVTEILSESGMSGIKTAYSMPVAATFKGSVSEETVDLIVYVCKANGKYKIFYLEAEALPEDTSESIADVSIAE